MCASRDFAPGGALLDKSYYLCFDYIRMKMRIQLRDVFPEGSCTIDRKGGRKNLKSDRSDRGECEAIARAVDRALHNMTPADRRDAEALFQI